MDQTDGAEVHTTGVSPTAEQHEAKRLRGPRRLLRIGPVAAFAFALLSGALGADGSVGFLLLVLLLAVTFATTGVWVGAGLLVDEFRGAPTSRRRWLLTAAMFVAALVAMTAAGGVASTLGAGA